MTTTQELLQKAAITTDAIASAGKLNPKQADRFLDFVFDETVLKSIGCRTVKFRSEKMEIEKITVANRVAVPASEASDPSIRRGVTTSKVTLEPKEIMVPFEMSDLFKDENIESDNVEEHVIKMMATRCGNNIEELYFDGNTVGPAVLQSSILEGGSSTQYVLDSYLALFNGLLKLAESGHIVDAANAAMSSALVAQCLRAMPTKFRKNKKEMRFLLSSDHEQQYREGVSNRATASGDKALEGALINPFGVPLQDMPLLSDQPTYVENSVANNDGTTATSLTYAPITSLVLTPTTLGSAPATPYVAGVDYNVDLTNGTWTRLGAGSIGSAATVKATYKTAGRGILTVPKNIVLAIGRDISIEKDRNIFKRVNEYAIHLKVYVAYEETDAVVLLKNIAVPS